MIIEVRSGAIRRKIMKPDHFPECLTRKSATGYPIMIQITVTPTLRMMVSATIRR
jgi:hypothetical protein